MPSNQHPGLSQNKGHQVSAGGQLEGQFCVPGRRNQDKVTWRRLYILSKSELSQAPTQTPTWLGAMESDIIIYIKSLNTI